RGEQCVLPLRACMTQSKICRQQVMNEVIRCPTLASMEGSHDLSRLLFCV
uniref:Uncharacterized protein n=1 Tax=Aegilops tauschii subsp. strangulata TaxID=200361 RepID=A0A453JXI7_AEGTS